MKAPFPYFGGKSKIAPEVWRRLGPDVGNYVEPFFGSGACLLARPEWTPGAGYIETVNDKDGMVANFWRALQDDPAAVAGYADWPANENDLHARHAWLVRQKFETDFIAQLEGDPDYYDPKIAGWWVWGLSLWIGGGFCSGDGPWQAVDGRLENGDAGKGVTRKLLHLGDAGKGVTRKLLHLGDAGQGVKRGSISGLPAYFETLAARLRRVRVCCGDWARVVTFSVTENNGTTAVFLDPPYSAEAGRDNSTYAEEDLTVAHAAREWAISKGDNPRYRIALCGYDLEHEEAMPDDWERLSYSGNRGMAHIGNDNRHREVVWFSPHCLKAPVQMRMFVPSQSSNGLKQIAEAE
jgi:hypothetical protein